jgi:2-isopropylmalate synthase
MSKERLYLFDTTLRDGAQTTGVDFSLEDKRLIARTLDELGVDYIEGGYPGANVTDTELFAVDPGLKHATFTAFGMTKRAGRSIANDPGFQATLQAKAGAVCLVARPGTITCVSRSASPTRRTSRAWRSRSRP